MNQEQALQNEEQLSQLSGKELVKIILNQQKIIAELQIKIEKLILSRDLDSKNSSKPPSSDLLKKPEKKPEGNPREKPLKKKKPGGQLGHPGKRCNCCGETTTPAWSNQIIPGQDLGIKLQGLLGWLGNYGNLPYEKQQELLWELGRIQVGLGTLVATNQRISSAIKPSVIELEEWINQNHPTLNIDETPWPVKGLKEWLWVFANPNFCLFRAGDTRSRAEIQDQLGMEYPGIMISDDFSVYNGYPVAAQQKCQAHLRRHCQKLITTPGKENKLIGEALTEIIDEAFKQHRLWRENGNQQNYLDSAAELKTRINLTLNKWIEKAGYEARKLLRNLKLKADQWWYFLDHPEIAPDNNLAERALRLAVTKRKVSGGSRSLGRFQETANLLSVIQTCRFQGRSVMDFFTQSLMATVAVTDRPSLISHFNT